MRPWHVGVVFGACLAVLLAAMGWISLKALDLDRALAQASRQSAVEENVLLALWRMESSLATLIAQESARPYFSYSPFYPAERAYTRMFAEIQPNEVRLPSALLTATTPHVLIHFQIEPDGKITSPQVPHGNMRDLAESGYTTHERIQEAETRLTRLQSVLDRGAIWAALPLISVEQPVLAVVPSAAQAQANALMQSPQRRSFIEGTKREMTYQQAAQSNNFNIEACQTCPDVREGMMRPIWAKNVLILARKITVNRSEYVQGCELDWPAIRRSLLTDVSDLLPHADLQPVLHQNGEKQTHMLAALPAQLIPGNVPVEAAQVSPIRISLLMVWICVLVAATAVGVLLSGVVTLSERRSAFVSAVTHELRTPLTTLRMYTEMLAERMVPDEQKRAQYLETMRAEADRLAHLVENVLSYSRLERTGTGEQMVAVPLAELFGQVLPRLIQRAQQAGMSLVFPTDPARIRVRADVGAVDQILFNLVDNACKYAAAAPDRTICISCEPSAGRVAIKVRDQGPGISPSVAGRLFRPFSKSARDAANSAPGVGLGLALSRRLARNMGGDLRVENGVTTGASFVFTLPCADPA